MAAVRKNAPPVTKRQSAIPGGSGGTHKSGRGNLGTESPHRTRAAVNQGAKNPEMGVRGPSGSFASVMMNQYTNGNKGKGMVGNPSKAKAAKNVIPGY
jgi:hypothetical protein